MRSSHPSHAAAPTLHQTPQGLLHDVPAYGFRLLSHRMSAGFPSPAADYTEEELDLNTYLVSNKPATFIFSVKGDSMVGASIEDGDKVVVGGLGCNQCRIRPRHGEDRCHRHRQALGGAVRKPFPSVHDAMGGAAGCKVNSAVYEPYH